LDKSGVEYIPDSYYVMDGFHLRKAILKAAGADDGKREALALAIWNGKWSQMNRLLISFAKRRRRSLVKGDSQSARVFKQQLERDSSPKKVSGLLVDVVSKPCESHSFGKIE